MKTLAVCVSVLLLFAANQLPAATFYLSPTGNDANPGTTAAAAWKTIAHLNIKLADGTITPGDSILFQRGKTFEGQVNFSQNDLHFGVWGTGAAKAIIKGSKTIKGWTKVSGNLWRTSAPTAPALLFSKGKLQPLARYPNAGWMLLDADGTASSISDPEISASGIAWAGGKVVLRSIDWLYETRTITGHAGNTINYASTNYVPEAGRNFYLAGVQSALDATGEWFYNAAEQRIYFMAPAGKNPNSLQMEASVHPHGLKAAWNRQQIRIEHLEFRYQSAEAVWLAGGGCADNSLKNNVFRACMTGTWVMGPGVLVESNKFEDVLFRGVQVQEFTASSVIKKNTFARVGLEPQFQDYGSCVYFILSTGGTIAENTIDSCGGDGIRVTVSTGFVVEKNVVKKPLSIICDGGGIYTYESVDGVIRQNFVSLVRGDKNGTSPGGIANGIYIDNGCDDILVEKNTVWDITGQGMVGNAGTHGIIFRSNTAYNCGNGLRFDDWIFDNPISGCRAARNVLYSLENEQFPIVVNSAFGRFDPATFDSNYYFNPFDFYCANRAQYSNLPKYTLAGWQGFYPTDLRSKEAWFSLNRRPVAGAPGAEMLANGSFNANTNGWSCWSDNGGSCSVAWDNSAGMTGGALRHEFGGSATFGLVISPTFSVTSGQWYNLKAQLKSDLAQDVEVTIQQNYGNYQVLQTVRLLPAPNGAARSFDLTFQSTATDGPVRVNFLSRKPGQKIWLDEVSLRPCSVSNPDPKLDHKLFVNPSAANKSFSLGGVPHKNLDNQLVTTASVVVPAWSSRVLVRASAVPLAPAADDRAMVIGKSADAGLRVFPNPVSERLFFEHPDGKILGARVLDLTGRLVFEQGFSADNQWFVSEGLPVGHLPKGSYWLEVLSEGCTARVGRFVKN